MSEPSLRVRVVEDSHGLRRLALCLPDGTRLPLQRAADFRQVYGAAPEITVTFVIDGRSIVLGDG